MHSLLEKHLEEICPKCGKKHDNNWKSQFDKYDKYAHYCVKECTFCGYELFFKTVESSGH